MLDTERVFGRAYETRDAHEFMTLVFPPEWKPITARILESGVTMSNEVCPWAPRWTPVSPTIRPHPPDPNRQQKPDVHERLRRHVKSCIYRAHDLLHQLWGLPVPRSFCEDERFVYKRAQMCGEVAVLTLTEFVLCRHLREMHPSIVSMLWVRNALPLLEGPLRGRSTHQIAARLDDILHKKTQPRWLRESEYARSFVADYVPMLEEDRRMVDHNWQLMKKSDWCPTWLPNVPYNPDLDGLELTMWMITDFYHLLETSQVPDPVLASFNASRRRQTVLPAGWNELPVG